MKQTKSFFILTVVLLAAYLLNACGPMEQQVESEAESSSDQQAANKVRAAEVAFTGVVESIEGKNWVINGQTIEIDPSVVREGPFQVGDTVKVEGEVNPDGSITVTGVETPSADDLSNLPQLGDGNFNQNSNDDNTNDSFSDDNTNSSNNNEIVGVVESFDGTVLVVDGVEFSVEDFTEMKDLIAVGDTVKIEFVINEDGTLSITEIELATAFDDDSNSNSNSNSNVNSNDDNSNDDNDNDSNSNDDDSKDDNSNDSSNSGSGKDDDKADDD